MYKIDKNVPIPKDARGRQSKYPWGEMKTADSFFVPTKTSKEAEVTKRKLAASAYTYHKRNKGTRFRVHVVTEGKKLGVRAWRLA